MKNIRNIAPFGLRMPEELKESLSERAKHSGRSLNAEIVSILSESVTEKGSMHGFRDVDLFKEFNSLSEGMKTISADPLLSDEKANIVLLLIDLNVRVTEVIYRTTSHQLPALTSLSCEISKLIAKHSRHAFRY